MCLPLCCAGSALCCAGQACCSCLCAPCAKLGVHSKNFSKIGYVIFQKFWIIISILLLFTGQYLEDVLPDILQCNTDSGDQTSCIGPSVIIRMSFVLSIFHAIIFIFILARNTTAAMFHDGCWGFKFLIVIGFFIGTLWIPNTFFAGYMTFTRYISVIFLICQAIIMLVVAYKINETLVSNYEQEESDGFGCSGLTILLITVIITLGNITWAVYQYIWYHSCGYNDVIITITIVASLIFYVIVFFRTREDASILTSSIVVSYILYLQWSALASNPDTTCNPFTNSAANTTMQIIAGLIFTFLSLAIISGSTKSSDKENMATTINQPLLENDDSDQEGELEDGDGKKLDSKKLHTFPISTATILFQALLILAAIYYSMLFTNWGNPTIFEDTTTYFAANKTSFWVKLVAMWLTTAIYAFSMFAPLIFPDREF